MKKIHLHGLRLIGILLFLWVLSGIDRSLLIATLRTVSLSSVLLFLALMLPAYLLKSWRWYLMTNAAGIHTSFAEDFRIYSASLFLGLLTPGKIGEAMKIPALVAHGASLRKSTVLTILDRFIDAVFIGGLSIVAVGVLISWQAAALMTAGVIGCIVVGARMNIVVELRQRARELGTGVGPILWVTAASWVLYFIQLIILRDGFGLMIPALPFVSIMTIVGIINMLPIAPAGLGTRDMALLFFFTEFHVPAEQTVAFSFAIFVLTLVGSLIGAVCWLYSPHPRS